MLLNGAGCMQDYCQELHTLLANLPDTEDDTLQSRSLCRFFMEALRFRGFCGAYMHQGDLGKAGLKFCSEHPEAVRMRMQQLVVCILPCKLDQTLQLHARKLTCMHALSVRVQVLHTKRYAAGQSRSQVLNTLRLRACRCNC